jgi:hypothetical protein
MSSNNRDQKKQKSENDAPNDKHKNKIVEGNCQNVIAFESIEFRQHFSKPKLARDLLAWTMQDSNMDLSFGNHIGFRNLADCNQSTNLTVALLLVHQYGYGEIGSLPKKEDGKFKDLLPKKKQAFTRGQEIIQFLTSKNNMFSGTPLEGLTTQILLEGNLYEKIDGLKKKVKSGIFDPDSSNCYSEEQCKGIYWGHYRKLNQVTEALFDLDTHLFVSKDDEKLYIQNTDRLYKNHTEVSLLAMQTMQERIAKKGTRTKND